MSPRHKPLVWSHGEVKTPPLGESARIEPVYLLRLLQRGDVLSMPQSRPLRSIGPHCHELRIVDADKTWRIVYRVDADAVVIAEVFAKKTKATPKHVLANCKRRLRQYDSPS